MIAYVVESPALDGEGKRVGTFKVYVATQARAESLASEIPGRTWRKISFEDMPAEACKNMLSVD